MKDKRTRIKDLENLKIKQLLDPKFFLLIGKD